MRGAWVVLLVLSHACATLVFQSAPTDLGSTVGSGQDVLVARAGDVNNDGFTDAVVMQANGNLYLYKNNGVGGFVGSSLGNGTPTGAAYAMLLKDMNGDGYLDIVVGEGITILITLLTTGSVQWLKNSGPPSYTFASRAQIVSANIVMWMAAVDIDLDGDMDMVIGTSPDNKVLIVTATSNGVWSSTTTTVATLSGLAGVAAADYTNDGLVDIVALVAATAATVRLYPRVGTSYPSSSTLTTSFAYGTEIINMNINGDGKADLMALSSRTLPSISAVAEMYWIGAAASTPTAFTTAATISNALDAGLGDWNNDTYNELVVIQGITSNQLVFYLGVDGVSFGATGQTIYSGTTAFQPLSLAVADFNKDGAMDLFFGSKSSSPYLVGYIPFLYDTICERAATYIFFANATVGTCTAGSSVSSTCNLDCVVGTYVLARTSGTCTGTPFPTWQGQTVTCAALFCPPIANASNYVSLCQTANTAYQGTCTLGCASGFTGANISRTCSTGGSGTWSPPALVPTCATASCSALAADAGNSYSSTCTSGATWGASCLRACNTGYAGASVFSLCNVQSQIGGAGLWNSTTTPTCTITVCPAIATGAGYVSQCGSTTTPVGLGCVLYCATGYAGSNVTRQCGQVAVGASASWDSVAPPTCIVTTCPSIANGANYTSACATSNPNVGGNCTMTCSPGYAGTAVTRQCVQTAIGIAATWDSSSVPSCTATQCAAVPNTAAYNTTCATSNVGATCRLTCNTGYLGASKARQCVQASAGAAAGWNDTTAPTCNQGCLPFPVNASTSTNCTTTVAVGSTCQLACATGYAGPSRYVRCQATFNYTDYINPTCTLSMCPPIPSTVSYTSSCASAGTLPPLTCAIACATGYNGSPVTRTCQASYNWDNSNGANCSIATCPPLPSDTSYTSSCTSGGVYQDSCTRTCNTGYSGAALSSTCTAAGTWSVSQPPQCVPTNCSALPAGAGYDSACAGNVTLVAGQCTQQCSQGYAGTAITHTCLQGATGAAAAWDSTTTPTCSLTSCPTVASTASYTTSCAANATSVLNNCSLTCAAGYAGAPTARQCMQAAVGSTAAWDQVGTPSCTPISCTPITSTSNYTSACDNTTTSYGSSCTVTCAAFFTAAPITRACAQSVSGGPSTWTPSVPISCGDPVLCPAIANTTSVVTTCSQTPTLAGFTCALQCRPQYQAASAVATCQISGAWDNASPLTCTPLSCAAVNATALPAGTVINTCTGPVSVGQQCLLDCATQYRANNPVAGTCSVVQPGVLAMYVGQSINCTYIPPVCGNGIVEASEFCDWGTAAMSAAGACCQNCTFMPSTFVCRAATGVCDKPEYCSGSGVCPPNTFINGTQCSAADTSGCTPSSSCDGTSPNCPTPNYAPAGTPCTGADPCLEDDVCVAGTGKCMDGNRVGCCGNSVLNKLEECDDGNTVSGDGCSSVCKAENGYTCSTVGQPCTPWACPVQNQVPDCSGTCGGYAVIDSCGDCVGGNTGLLPNRSRDACGICYGGNSSLDSCGDCFGGNRAKDLCGVCRGDNSTCKGCDGVPNSGKKTDVCGVCGGSGNTCLGCNGVPIPQGGANVDRCGVCGGDGTSCALGCDGVWGSGLTYDCAGTCGDTAKIDRCGTCWGGTTNNVENAGYNSLCNSCFTPCSLCAGTYDVCGVCNGDGKSCLGCNTTTVTVTVNNSTKVTNFDGCGLCGGNNLSCVRGCDGVLGSLHVYDCSGLCGGNATIDSCGVCAGGVTGVEINIHMDDCGICFGGNQDKDSCGVCFGFERERDACGVCNGRNASVDACGFCYGRNRTMDACGVCGGDSTTCMGCDRIPNSGRKTDICGVCGGTDMTCEVAEQPSAIVSTAPAAANTTVYAVTGSILGCLVLVCLALCLLQQRRAKLKANKMLDDAEKTENEAAPQGKVALVITDIQNSTILWEAQPLAMSEALDIHDAVLRQAIAQCKGYEIRTEGDCFRVAFHNGSDAVKFCMLTQLLLMEQTWPDEILQMADCATETAADGRLIWHGPRVRMGAHFGDMETMFDQRTMRMDYRGENMTIATAVQSEAMGGQILISEPVFNDARKFIKNEQNGIRLKKTRVHTLKSVRTPMVLHEICALEIENRVFAAAKAAKPIGSSSRDSSPATSHKPVQFSVNGSDSDGFGSNATIFMDEKTRSARSEMSNRTRRSARGTARSSRRGSRDYADMSARSDMSLETVVIPPVKKTVNSPPVQRANAPTLAPPSARQAVVAKRAVSPAAKPLSPVSSSELSVSGSKWAPLNSIPSAGAGSAEGHVGLRNLQSVQKLGFGAPAPSTTPQPIAPVSSGPAKPLGLQQPLGFAKPAPATAPAPVHAHSPAPHEPIRHVDVLDASTVGPLATTARHPPKSPNGGKPVGSRRFSTPGVTTPVTPVVTPQPNMARRASIELDLNSESSSSEAGAGLSPSPTTRKIKKIKPSAPRILPANTQPRARRASMPHATPFGPVPTIAPRSSGLGSDSTDGFSSMGSVGLSDLDSDEIVITPIDGPAISPAPRPIQTPTRMPRRRNSVEVTSKRGMGPDWLQ